MAAFAIGALSIIGVPPFCGFFSKWYLALGGIDAGQYGFVAALVFSSLVNVVLFFRIFEISYYVSFSDHHKVHHEDRRSSFFEAPVSMLVPLLMVAGLLLVLGMLTGDVVSNIIQFAIPNGIL
jgi:multicomponent Na+:H+ antiporter subunit D